MQPPTDHGSREVRAAFDEEGIWVFQAYCDGIADAALRRGTFAEGFGRNRMTWIKPSFGWMLYRSKYASAANQERILRIKITHTGFTKALSEAVPTAYDATCYTSRGAWQAALAGSRARVQWDPDRDLQLAPVNALRTIQLGLAPSLVSEYVDQWILTIEDVTGVARSIENQARVPRGLQEIEHPFPEARYPVPEWLASRIGMTCPT